MTWLWLLGALVLGGALLVVATAADARARRQAQRAAVEVPARGRSDVDSHQPAYVPQTEIDALPSPGTTDTARGRRFGVGLAHPDLAASTGTASLESPRVLVVEGEITAMRQLLGPLGAANAERGLLIVAGRIDDEVGRTLAANRRALGMAALACVGGPGDLIQIAEAVGAEILTGDDLRAGYVPAQAYGSARRVWADRRRTWIDTGEAETEA